MARRRRSEEAAIRAEGLGKTYDGDVQAVRGVDFDVAPGEVFGLVGPNGAGKSTTLGMLTTTVVPTAGRAMVGGFDVARQPLQVRSVSSLVFQDPVVDRTLTGRRNLEIHARLWAADARRIESTARALGVAEILDRTVSTYSGGQRRRLEIARALTSRPSVLFLDEPTVGLDPRIRHELVDVIARLRNHSDVTILLTTHYLDEAERLCDRVAVMHAGRIAAVDTPKALLAGLGAEVLEVRVSGDPDEAVDALRARRIAGADTFVVGQTVTVPLHGKRSSRVLAIVGQLGLRASAVTTRAPTLDDVYLRLTGDRLAETV